LPRDIRNIRARGKTYWKLWLALVTIFLVARFTILLNTSENIRYWVFNSYALTLVIYLVILESYEGYRSFYYLEDNHPDIFIQVYGNKGYTPVFNSFKIYKYIHSKDDYGDVNISILKSNEIAIYRLMLISLFTSPIMFLLFML
jgi:hypothetical protein